MKPCHYETLQSTVARCPHVAANLVAAIAIAAAYADVADAVVGASDGAAVVTDAAGLADAAAAVDVAAAGVVVVIIM